MKEFFRSWWGWTLVTLFVLIVGTAAWIRLDVAPPEDADLLVARREVPAERNGFVMLGLADGDTVVRDPLSFFWDFGEDGEGESDLPFTREEVDAAKKMALGRNWNETIANWMLTENRGVLATFREALDAPEFHVTEEAIEDTIYTKMQSVARLVGIKAHSEARAGRVGEAVDWILYLRRFAEKYRAAGLYGLYFSSACSIESGFGIGNLLMILNTYEVPDAVLVRIARNVPAKTRSAESAIAAFRFEYARYRKMVDAGVCFDFLVEDLTWREDFGYRPYETLTEIARESRKAIRALEARDGSNPMSGFEPTTRLSAFNDLGRSMLEVFAENEWLIDMALMVEIEYRLAAVLFAAERYRRKYGVLPKKLTDLVPEFLDGVPRDPYSPKDPLRLRDDGVVYSVGDDGIDHGGRQRRSVARAEAAAVAAADDKAVGDEEDWDEDGHGHDHEEPLEDWEVYVDDDWSLELFLPKEEKAEK
ncbi:MAG: hypothetical protein AAF517_00450 [Planctomycetota bacterium]